MSKDDLLADQDKTMAPRHEDEGVGFLEIGLVLRTHWRLIVAGVVVAAIVGYSLAWLMPTTYTAQTTILPPQQQQSAAASALSSLGALAGLPGAAAIRNPADQYIALMESATVSDRIVDRFGLMQLYGRKYLTDARLDIRSAVRIGVGKRDGLITVTVDDHDAKRAADIANAYVEELRRMTAALAITEAQQRRAFFEKQLTQTKERLISAQRALQASGFNASALRSEPRAAAESYARLQAEATAAEVRLQTLSSSLSDKAPEVRQTQENLAALRSQLKRQERVAADPAAEDDYIGRFREFKYQETLLDMFSRQYEIARLDESREGTLIQVVDVATPPEKRSKPIRSQYALGAAIATLLLLGSFVVCRHLWRNAARDPQFVRRVSAMQTRLSRR